MAYTNVSVQGKYILHQWKESNNEDKKELVLFKPSMFVFDSNGKHRCMMTGKPMQRLQYENMFDCRKDFKNKVTRRIEDGLIPALRGNNKFEEQFINERYPQDLIQTKNDINVGIIDIEVDVPKGVGFPHPFVKVSEEEWEPLANYPINAITLFANTNKTYYVFGLGGDWKHNRDDTEFRSYDNEADLLREFLEVWNELNLHVISGWNSLKFDIPYIYARLNRILGEGTGNKLSSWHTNPLVKYLTQVNHKTDAFKRPYTVVEITGMTQMDYLELYKKFTFTVRENYKLDHISHVELNTKKIDYSSHQSLYGLYREDYEKFMHYNLTDVELISKMDDKLGLIDIALSITMLCKTAHKNFAGSISPISAWIFSDLVKNKLIMTEKTPMIRGKIELEGAYVADPVVGLHKYVASFDLNSLYPSIIRALNLSPETKGKKYLGINKTRWLNDEMDEREEMIKGNNLSMAADGQTFSTETQGIFPRLISNLYNTRKIEKNMMLEMQQKIVEIDIELKKRQFK
jgi:DNA polymerase elongation subunit (family B)